jgi:hypothetical protein
MVTQEYRRKKKDGAEDKVNETEEQSNPTWKYIATQT